MIRHSLEAPAKYISIYLTSTGLAHATLCLRVFYFLVCLLPSASKVRCILRNIVRDWAEEGAEERRQTYDPILRELRRKFPDRLTAGRPPSCLVPGAGLGRLALEISSLGFACQGNDFSFYILVCSSFILNFADRPRQWPLHPWLLSSSNVVRDSDQLAAVMVPDVVPGLVGVTEGFSMCAGDFVEVYRHPEHRGEKGR